MDLGSRNFLLIERLISCGLALLVILFMDTRNAMFAYIVLGHAHFALCYLYQAKAGNIKPWMIAAYIAVLIPLFYISQTFTYAFILFAALTFILHHFFDELTVYKRKPTLFYILVTTGIGVLTGNALIDYLWHTDLTQIALPIAAIAGAGALYTYKRDHWKVDAVLYDVFPSAFFVILFALTACGYELNAIKTFGFIILVHYFMWYVHLIGKHIAYKTGKLTSFIRDTVIVNAIFIAGYIFVTVKPDIGSVAKEILYTPASFYVWTIMHLITTFRLSDYKGIRIRAAKA